MCLFCRSRVLLWCRDSIQHAVLSLHIPCQAPAPCQNRSMFNVRAGPNYSAAVVLPSDASWSVHDVVLCLGCGQMAWHGRGLPGHLLLICCSAVTDICCWPRSHFFFFISKAPVLGFRSNFSLFWRLKKKNCDEPQLPSTSSSSSSLVASYLSCPALPPGGLVGEQQLSHHLLLPFILNLLLLLLLLPLPAILLRRRRPAFRLPHSHF